MKLKQLLKEMNHYEYRMKHADEIDRVYYEMTLRKYYMKLKGIMEVEI